MTLFTLVFTLVFTTFWHCKLQTHTYTLCESNYNTLCMSYFGKKKIPLAPNIGSCFEIIRGCEKHIRVKNSLLTVIQIRPTYHVLYIAHHFTPWDFVVVSISLLPLLWCIWVNERKKRIKWLDMMKNTNYMFVHF